MPSAETIEPADGPSRPRDPWVEYARIGLGIVVLLVLVLAGLAFINSFFLEPPAPPGPGGSPATGSPQPADGGGGDSEARACDRVVAVMRVFFFLSATATVAMYAVGIVRRAKHDNRIATSPWGILGTVLFFVTLLFLGAWRIANFVCNEEANCLNLTNGTYSAYLVLILLTFAGVGVGMALAHFRGRHFFATGWGLIGVVLFLPAVLTGFAWYMVRLVCSPRLSCATRDAFLATLAWTFWLALIGAIVALGIGLLILRHKRIDPFASGWAVLAILLAVLAALAGAGWKLAGDVQIPGCDPFEDEIPTCEEIKDRLQDRLRATLWTLLAVAGALGFGFLLYRKRPRDFFTSPFAIVAYVLLALAGLAWILLLFSGTLCGEAQEEPPDATPTATPSASPTSTGPSPSGTGSPSPSGSPRPTSGGGGGGPGGGGGGGPDFGGGSGGGGVGPPQVPLELGTLPLVWVLVIVGALVGGALLYLLLKHRRTILARGPRVPQAAQVQAQERAQLLRMLDNANLRSAEAVIAAYRGFLAWCAPRGVEKAAEETPHEHAERVRKQYPVPERAMQAFIEAYEVARLSTRQPTPTERQAAVRFARDIDEIAWSRPDSEEKP